MDLHKLGQSLEKFFNAQKVLQRGKKFKILKHGNFYFGF